MKNLVLTFLAMIVLVACKDEANRVVSLEMTPDGREFHFMPINEKGVTDITITIAWPTNWGYHSNNNPAVPYIGANVILSGGTSELAPQEILEIFNDKNARGFITPTPNHVLGEIEFPKEHVETVIGIASEMLQKPQFADAWVERTKQSTKNNQANALKQTNTKMWQVARKSILGDQALYESLSLSNLDSIDVVSSDDLRKWHRETFVKNGTTIAVTGAISREDAGTVIDRLLSGLGQGDPVATIDAKPKFTNKVVLLHVPEAEKTTLGFIGQLPATTDGKDTTDLLALNQFAKSGSGPLFDAVRTELRASYGFQAGYSNYDRATRIMFIAGEVETDKLNQTKDLILETYAKYKANPDLSGFEDLRKRISDGSRKNVGFVNVAARSVLQLALDGLDTTTAPKLAETIADITKDDVRARLTSAFPDAEVLLIVAASPDATALEGACVITNIDEIKKCR